MGPPPLPRKQAPTAYQIAHAQGQHRVQVHGPLSAQNLQPQPIQPIQPVFEKPVRLSLTQNFADIQHLHQASNSVGLYLPKDIIDGNE